MKTTFTRLLPLFLLVALALAACQPGAQTLPTATSLPPATAAPLPTSTLAPLPTTMPDPAPTATVAVPVTGSTASPQSTSSSMDDDYSDAYGDDSGGKKDDDSRKTPGAASGTRVNMVSGGELGSFLVDEQGMTLYLFTKDTPGVTVCFEGCLANWPPLLTNGQPVAGGGVDDSDLGTITRPDGAVQVTYRDLPLYYYIADQQPGDTNGQGVGGVWFVVEP